jgi:hypothetical protein
VHISVDGKTLVPLGVQVYPRGSQHAAIDISFTRFSDSIPSDDNFSWTPPPGVTVKQVPSIELPGPVGQAANPKLPSTQAKAGRQLNTIGTGWTTVFTATGVPGLAELGAVDGPAGKSAAPVLGNLPAVKGNWGSGRLFQSALISALFTDDGRAYVGAVDPDLLYHAAATK